MSNELAKKIRIMTDLIMPHNKWYKDNSYYVLNNIDEFDVSKLVEKTIAKLGEHKVVDGYGYDLSDGSEIKTCSVNQRRISRSKKGFQRSVFITNVATHQGKLKSGSLRVVVYNQFTDEVRYFFLPYKIWSKFNLHKQGHGYSIMLNYSINDDTFSMIDAYEVDDVKELATAINC